MRISGGIIRLLIGPAIVLSLAGCKTYGYRGPHQIVTVDGAPASAEAAKRKLDISLFQKDYDDAQALRTQADGNQGAVIARMLRSGFMYNYSFCSNYFYHMAIRQRNAKVARRLMPPLSALITGVVGLHDFSGNPDTKERIVQGVALGSAFSTSLLDVYEEQFLYGTENIDSVESLTLRALSVHREAVLARTDIRFEQAIQHLIDNQNLCSPQSVLTLARNAIKSAKVTPREQPTPAATGAAGAAGATGTNGGTGQIQVTTGDDS